MKKIIIILMALLALLAGGYYLWSADPLTKEYTIMDVARDAFDTTSETPVDLSPIELEAQNVVLPDGTTAEFQIAKPYSITVAAEDLGKARFMSMSPDGRMFVPDLVDYQLSHAGKIYILEDFNEETMKFETKHTYLSGLRGPNSVAFYRDSDGKDWLYVALTAHLLRYPYEAGDTEPSGEPEVILEFPNTQAPNAKSVVWHITRTLLFHGDRLYIGIGSGCNSCEHPEGEIRGMIYSMNPDGSDGKVYADGLRNAVGLHFADVIGGEEALYVTANGSDHLGADAPDELMYKLEEGKHYGWPYCYETDGVFLEDDSVAWEHPIPCSEVPMSFSAFTPRSAPLGLTYFRDGLDVLRGSFLVALHGSFDAGMKKGYEIVRVSGEGEHEIFMDGFQRADGTRTGRPVDFLQRDARSFFFTDDFTGRVYLVYATE